MKISVITPTFNSQETIQRNIVSVINQSYGDFEHIIIDNLSTDATLSIARRLYADHSISPKLTIISEKDSGISEAFNKGITASTGEIITILNSDDEFCDTTVFKEVIAAFATEQTLIVHGDMNFVDRVYGSNRRKPLVSAPIGVVFNHPGMFLKKEVYTKTGLYNTEFKYSMDYEYYCRLQQQYGDTSMISRYLSRSLVTMHAEGASWDNEIKSIHEIQKAMKIHRLWNTDGQLYYYSRISKARLKKYLNRIGLNGLIRVWRNYKWR